MYSEKIEMKIRITLKAVVQFETQLYAWINHDILLSFFRTLDDGSPLSPPFCCVIHLTFISLLQLNKLLGAA